MTRPDSYFPTAAAWVSAVRQMAERPSQIWEIFRFSQNLVRANNDLAIEAHVDWSYIGVLYEIRPRLRRTAAQFGFTCFRGFCLRPATREYRARRPT